MPHLSFDDLRWLNLLWAALALAGAGVYAIWQRRRAVRVFTGHDAGGAGLSELAIAIGAPRVAPPVTWTRGLIRVALVTLCLAALTAGIIGPRWGEVEQTVVRRGIDVIVLLDTSRSMLARDIQPNRLERAKLSIRDDLLPALSGDRVALITFAGLPSLKCPLTNDYAFMRLVLDDVNIESSPRGGTLIGDALRMAKSAFDEKIDTYKLILLITDGEDQDSFPVEAARTIWDEKKIPIVAVALGDEKQGARIPVQTDKGESYLEYEGKTVWSKANFDDLRRIAQLSELNAFVPVGTRDFDLGRIYREKIVPAIEYKQREEKQKVRQPAQFQAFAIAALVLLLIDSFLRDAPTDRSQRQNADRPAATGARPTNAAEVRDVA